MHTSPSPFMYGMLSWQHTAMAASVDLDTEAKKEQEDDVMATCKANIEAARKTIAAIESLDRRWKV